MKKMKDRKRKYKIASLFSGCGGMDLGSMGNFSFLGKKYYRLNTEVVYAMDFDRPICDMYNENFSLPCEFKDVRVLRAEEVPDHDILTGGFPCQSFSIVAQNPKRLGYNDEKGQLFFEMCRILSKKQPLAFIAENVRGILSANQGEAFPLILEGFRKTGYYTDYKVLNASHFGVPQKRERVFIVGYKDKNMADRFEFPEPTTLGKPVPLSAIVMDDSDIEDKYYFSERALKGLRLTKHSKTMNKGRGQRLDESCNTVGAHLAKVSLNSTDPVLFTNGRFRMFTPREVARIQSFPDKFKLHASKTMSYKALGNAVAPVVMWHLTRSVISAFEGNGKNKHKDGQINQSRGIQKTLFGGSVMQNG